MWVLTMLVCTGGLTCEWKEIFVFQQRTACVHVLHGRDMDGYNFYHERIGRNYLAARCLKKLPNPEK